MKQKINEEQLNKLNNKARERLEEWWKPRKGLPLMDWRNMIDYIHDNYGIWYTANIDFKGADNLCDMFWEIVKYVLND